MFGLEKIIESNGSPTLPGLPFQETPRAGAPHSSCSTVPEQKLLSAGELLPAVGIPGLGMQPVFWQTWMHHDCSKDLVVSVVGCAAPCLLFFFPNEVSHSIFLLKFLSPERKALSTCAARSDSVGPGILLQFRVFQESSGLLASGLIYTPPFASSLAVVRTGAAPAPTQAHQACSFLALA